MKNSKKTSALMITASMVLSVAVMLLMTTPVKAVGERMFADPAVFSSTGLKVGDKFNVSVKLENMVAILNIACSVSWDPYYVNLTKIYFGDCLGSGANNVVGAWDSASGYASDVTLFIVGAGHDIANGTAFIFSFMMMHPGESLIDVYYSYAADDIGGEYFGGDCPYDCKVSLTEVLMNPIDYNNDSTIDFYVQTVSNSSLSVAVNFTSNGGTGQIFFNVTGKTGSTGYINVTIPKALLDIQAPWAQWWIMIDNTNATSAVVTPGTNDTYIYANYGSGEHAIRMIGNKYIPEFSSVALLIALLAGTVIIVTSVRKVHKKLWQAT